MYLPIYQCIYLSICLSIILSIYLSIYLNWNSLFVVNCHARNLGREGSVLCCVYLFVYLFFLYLCIYFLFALMELYVRACINYVVERGGGKLYL